MRIYDDPIEVRRGQVEGPAGDLDERVEGPEQFLWHGRIWKVRTVLAHWVETGQWWRPVQGDSGQGPTDLLREREWWRVEAGHPRRQSGPDRSDGVFELFFDWSVGAWRLAGCLD